VITGQGAGFKPAPTRRSVWISGANAIKRVRSDNGVGESERIAAVARPGVFFRGGHHARPNRVAFDVAPASDEVAVGFDNRGAEAALEAPPVRWSVRLTY